MSLPEFLDFNTDIPSGEDLALNLLTDITKSKPLNLIPNNDEKFVKSLGILLDSKLKFMEHVSRLHGKMARAIFSINQIKNFPWLGSAEECVLCSLPLSFKLCSQFTLLY